MISKLAYVTMIHQLFLTTYCVDEPISQSFGLDLPENAAALGQVVDFTLEMMRTGVSLVARDVVKNTIVGFCANVIQVSIKPKTH